MIEEQESMSVRALVWAVGLGCGMWAVFLTVTLPAVGWATASPQPALVASDQAASRLAPTGFDQAQGGG